MYREPGTSLARLALQLDRRGVPTPSGAPRWSSPTIRGILRNPVYTGQVYALRTRYRAPTHRRSATHPIGRPHGTAVPQPADAWLLVGQVPAVVSRAHFDEVQAKLATNRPFARRNNTTHQYLLRALVSCGCCRLACTARATGGRNFYYLCGGKRRSTSSHRATRCAARYIPADQLDGLVWQDLCALLGEPGPLASAVARAHGGGWLPQELLARRETLRRGQAHLRQQLERLTDAYLRAVIPLDEYERRRRDLEQRVRALAGQEEQLRCDAARQQQLAGVAASVEAFRARVQRGLAEATFEQRRQLVLLLIDRVVVTGADVEIRYVLPTSAESERVRFCHLRKDYFQDPMQPVLDPPMAPDGGRQRLRRQLGARQVVAGLGRDLAAAGDAADGLDRQHRPQARPVLEGGEDAHVRAGEDAPAHPPPVAVVERVEAGAERPAEREGVGREPGPHLGVGLPAVALEGQQVVPAASRDPLGDRGLAGERVEAHQAAAQVQPVQQVGDGGQLAALALGGPLRQHQPALGGVGADQVQGRAALLPVERAAHRLAVDRDLPRRALLGAEHRPHPAEERALERLGVDQREDAAERVVRGDAVRQGEEAPEPRLLASAVEGDVLERLRLAEDGADRDHEDVDEPVLDLPPAARVLDRGEFGDQGFEHGLSSVGKGQALAGQPARIEAADFMRPPC